MAILKARQMLDSMQSGEMFFIRGYDAMEYIAELTIEAQTKAMFMHMLNDYGIWEQNGQTRLEKLLVGMINNNDYQ